MVFESDPWDSLISFEPGIPVQLGGTLELAFANDVDIGTQVGRTLHIFDWSGVNPSGQFQVASPYAWDIANLYTTGEVTLLTADELLRHALRAGDADQDLDFDQLDLVKVQVAAVYLTGQPATWGEGDWNGAPGGTVGAPPLGDGYFNQRDIVAALQAGIYLTGPYAAVRPDGKASDGQTSIIYNASTGQLAVDTPAGTELTSINIDSTAGIFTGDPAQNLGGSFDNDSDSNIFKATFGGSFGSLSYGNVAQVGLTEDFLLNDLTVIGSLAGGGALGQVDLIYVPEPSTAALIGLAFLTLGFCRLRRRKLGH